MRHILQSLTLLFSLFIFQSNAQQTEWRRVFFQDFGGNNINDPQYGDKLPDTQTNLPFTKSAIPGRYAIVKNSSDNNSWHKGGDHTNLGSNQIGYYMRIDPSSSSETVNVFKQSLQNVCKDVNFKFRVWTANISLNSEAFLPKLNLGLYKNATDETPIASFPITEIPFASNDNSVDLDWMELALEFKVEEDINELFFKVNVITPEPNGFDFALDDIEIFVEQPLISISTTPTELEYQQPATLSASFVNNGFFADLSNVIYKWQYSIDGENFSDIAGSQNTYTNFPNCSYTIPSFEKETHNGYYRVIIGEVGNLDNPICSIYKDFQINETKNKIVLWLCEGESKTYLGTTFTDQLEGQTVTLGGDYSVIIKVVHPEIKKDTTYLCLGEIKDGITYSVAGTYIDSVIIKSSDGCDSLITEHHLIVSGPTQEILPATNICIGETYQGKTYSIPGTYKETFNLDGCRVKIQDIIVHPAADTTIQVLICQGSEYNGKVYNTSGTFTAEEIKLTRKNTGCDSIIHPIVTVTEKIVADLGDVELCEGETYTFGGKTYSAAGTYALTSTESSKQTGCDSTTNVHLTINPKYYIELDTTICKDQKLFGKEYTEATEAGKPILVPYPIKLYTINGCDSTVIFRVKVLEIQLKLRVKSDRTVICEDEEIELIAEIKPSNLPVTWEPKINGDDPLRPIIQPTESSAYVVKANNNYGCDASDTVYINVMEKPIISIDSLNEKERYLLYSASNGTEPYIISIDKENMGSAPSGEIDKLTIGRHELKITDQNGCTDAEYFTLSPIPINPSGNVSPNGDGINDTWVIENIDVYPNATIRIYDRNGYMLKEYKGYDNDNGWNGTYNGKKLPSTDYWYEIDLEEADKTYIGHFTLLR